MTESLFISEDFLKNNSVINGNVDYDLLKPTIIMAQDFYIQEILGTNLFEDLVSKIQSNTLNSDETILIQKYIQKTLMWFVLMESTLDFKFRLMNKGVMVKSSENSQPADTKELLMLMDNRRNKAERYAELLTKYLTFNMKKFPNYRTTTLTGMNASSTNYTTGIYLDDENTDNEKPKKIIISVS